MGWWALLLACAGSGDGDTEDTGLAEVTLVQVGPAPWDGVVVQRELDDLTPVLAGPDGTVTGSPRDTPLSASIHVGPDGLLTPGEWSVVGIDGESTRVDEPFSVGLYGQDPDFSAGALEAATYELDVSSTFVWGELAQLQLSAEQHLVLQLAPGEDVVLRWAFVDENEGSCLLLDDTADLSATGTLTWSGTMDVVEQVVLEDATLRLGLTAEQDRIAGAELRFDLDTRDLSADVFPDEGDGRFCEFVEALGAGTCNLCDDGVQACVDAMALGMQLERIGEVDLSNAATDCDGLIDWWSDDP